MFEKSLVAIDIGSHAIKVVEFSGDIQKKLTKAGVKILPPGAIVNGAIQDRETVDSCLKSLLGSLGVRRFLKRAVLSLSGSSVIIKRIKLVVNEHMEFADQIFSMAEQQFQVDMNELYFDYFLCRPEPNTYEQHAIIVGAKRTNVVDRVAVVKKAGLSIGVVDCDVFSLANSFEYNYGGLAGLVAIVNVGMNSSQIIFLHDNEFLYNREIGIGGETYTQAIAAALKVSNAEAEIYKLRASAEEMAIDSAVVDAIKEINEQVLSELQSTVDLFLHSNDAPINLPSLHHVFLAGGGSRVLGLNEVLGRAMQIPIMFLDPFKNVDVPSSLYNEQLEKYRLMYGVVSGLGLRKLES